MGLRITTILLLSTLSACATTGLKSFKPLPGVDKVEIIHNKDSVRNCLGIKFASITDGNISNHNELNVPGNNKRAMIRVKNSTIEAGGNTFLITEEETTVISHPPKFEIKISGVVYLCRENYMNSDPRPN